MIVSTATWCSPSEAIFAAVKELGSRQGIQAMQVRDDAWSALGLTQPGTTLHLHRGEVVKRWRPGELPALATQASPRGGTPTPPWQLGVLLGTANPLALPPHARIAAFCLAASVGNVALLRSMAVTWPALVTQADAPPAGNRAIHYAAMFNQQASAEFLLEQSRDNATARNPVHTQPMHDAVRGGYVNLMRRLHDAGAPLFEANEYQDTVFHRLALFCAPERLADYVACLNYCIAKSTEHLNDRNEDGLTALDIAIVLQHAGLVEALRAAGAAPSNKDLTLLGREDVDHRRHWQQKEKSLTPAAKPEAA